MPQEVKRYDMLYETCVTLFYDNHTPGKAQGDTRNNDKQ